MANNDDLTREVYTLLKEFIALLVPLRNDPQRKMMMDGILLSIINSKYVCLYGLTKQQEEMQKRLVKLVCVKFPDYLKGHKSYPTYIVDSIDSLLGVFV